MKKILLLFSVLLLTLPFAAAVMTHTYEASLQSNLVTQGYQFARIQGVNTNNRAVNIIDWILYADLGLSNVRCQFQPTFLVPNGPYEVVIPIQCQTRSSMTTLFPTGTQVKVDVSVPDDVQPNSFTVGKVWIETRPQVPTPFPTAPLAGQAVNAESASSFAGTAIFIAGIAAIAVLAAAVILFSMRRDE